MIIPSAIYKPPDNPPFNILTITTHSPFHYHHHAPFQNPHSAPQPLSPNGPHLPRIGIGTMSLGGAYKQQNTLSEKLAFLTHAHSIGQTFWDTADIYFSSEAVIGEWFKQTGKREDIFLATKFGLSFENMKQEIRSDPEYVRFACERSLGVLGTDWIDLFYCHRVDGKTPVERTVEAMVELKREGKIKYLGLSEVSATTLRRAHAVHPITAVQMEYSPFCLDIEYPQSDLLRTCRELGVAVVAYSPIGRGLLTGQFTSSTELGDDDFRRIIPRYSSGLDKILAIVQRFKAIGEKHECTPAQVALGWLLAQGPDIFPIPGTRSVKYLEENAAAVDVVLSEEEVVEIRELVDMAGFEGERYPDGMTILPDTPEL
ncbi:aldo/keto reductase [Aspergillus sclerotioniger CBS 115572]|uniref:Aldo/keto reductase n=1 Tax=Aspergillus sclerotioniger CBS 115572 TaxID=1450535 RepID=A0A317UUG8_9EURO|nr:aldo/keto reductase [Aspergillus sclerotioniger CBS 115572]PWY65683.1 aldo/keto reductase [Aspergillus sclerotioniger CBS 115572]